MEVLNEPYQYHCPCCEQPVREGVRYCPHCGAYQQAEKTGAFNSVALRSVLIYYFVTLIICLLVKLDSVVSNVYDLMAAYAVDAVVTITFAVLNFNELKNLFNVRKVKPALMLAMVPAACASALAVNVFAEGVNRNLFNAEEYFYYFYQTMDNPVLWMVIMIAVFPAIFEELAFRGFLHNHVRKLVDWRATLLITAFLFALMHLTVFSFIWLFPFGWLLAWLRHKHESLWYGIIFHFIFNLTAIFYELWSLDVL